MWSAASILTVLTPRQTAGAMIVDFASYMTYQPTGSPILGPFCQYEGHVTELSPERQVKKMFQDIYRFSWDGYQAKLEPNDEQLLCCSPHVLGYALKQKTWVQLLVKYLGEPKEADLQTFNEKLQLDEDAKALISNSVKAHEKVKKREDGRSKGLEDFAPGKGKGLVIMLYGKSSFLQTSDTVITKTDLPQPSFCLEFLSSKFSNVYLHIAARCVIEH